MIYIAADCIDVWTQRLLVDDNVKKRRRHRTEPAVKVHSTTLFEITSKYCYKRAFRACFC
ncbi:hypothetical protein I7I48_00221 [Histoplasma ohiense]|nr:hypothetical protein I7I48_00221 [Histoplasma ohiense (nom. inval.)]